MGKKNIFIIGLEKMSRQQLQRLPVAEDYEFHAALCVTDFQSGRRIDIEQLIERAINRIKRANVPVDAIVSFYDFPSTLLLPVLAQHFGVLAPTLENVLKCEHKYWARMEQKKVIPEHIPDFAVFDPFDDDAHEEIPLNYPYWIKPFKSLLSFLAYRINNRNDYMNALPEIRNKSGYFSKPFNYFLETYGMPAHITAIKESFIAESLLTGRMCTAEGFVFNGDVQVYGIVDSITEPGRSSFSRYEYPSSLPQGVQFRIADIVRRVISGIGLDNSLFNIEFFWDRSSNQIWLLEINPRMSQSHADIFEKIHGVSHHAVMLDVALGMKPETLENNGDFKMAAKFMYRVFRDAVVTRVPDKNIIREIGEKIPGTVVIPRVKVGQRLSSLPFQESYSYLLADIFIGGRDQSDLVGKYHRSLELLDFGLRYDDRVFPESVPNSISA